eukprot:TRINITY_DN17463_c0_g1::TRINITY_DN17463_c0_g1_i1::g.28014::m.28014 TRINITY_DN17463_c0_g1::TRINITY_DN17463_c0_g1_i1::g.28014  ORF type:complete len:106 (-),score=-6.55,sp/P53871/DUG3_YEAST/44.79/1e-20,GATase_4/PF13230.1/0.0008 TRINITY_DN17463_c0_g1_i1:846-1163(-)
MLNSSPLNGDGFGVGWYSADSGPDVDDTPCVFVSISPAWNSRNLRRLAEKISSPLCFAHVRAASPGLGFISSQYCHSFSCLFYMFFHYGDIPCFQLLQTRMRLFL